VIRVTHLYPTTYWCEVPREDMTNKSLCRPLPSQNTPPPPLIPEPLGLSSPLSPPRFLTYHLLSPYPKNARGIARVGERQVQHPRFIPEPLQRRIPSDQTTWCPEPRQRATLTIPPSHSPTASRRGPVSACASPFILYWRPITSQSTHISPQGRWAHQAQSRISERHDTRVMDSTFPSLWLGRLQPTE
jgi:hypothetical protein